MAAGPAAGMHDHRAYFDELESLIYFAFDVSRGFSYLAWYGTHESIVFTCIDEVMRCMTSTNFLLLTSGVVLWFSYLVPGTENAEPLVAQPLFVGTHMLIPIPRRPIVVTTNIILQIFNIENQIWIIVDCI